MVKWRLGQKQLPYTVIQAQHANAKLRGTQSDAKAE